MQQGQDGSPHLTYYDRTHALSFVWDGTADQNEDRWIDVSYGGYAEPVIARIPFVIRITGWTGNVTTDTLTAFALACRGFIDVIHDIEDVTIGHAARCSSDDPNNHQGATCPIHEDAALIEARVR